MVRRFEEHEKILRDNFGGSCTRIFKEEEEDQGFDIGVRKIKIRPRPKVRKLFQNWYPCVAQAEERLPRESYVNSTAIRGGIKRRSKVDEQCWSLEATYGLAHVCVGEIFSQGRQPKPQAHSFQTLISLQKLLSLENSQVFTHLASPLDFIAVWRGIRVGFAREVHLGPSYAWIPKSRRTVANYSLGLERNFTLR